MFTLNVADGVGFTAAKGAVRVRKTALRILIVEDDEADAYLIKRLLAEHHEIGEVIRAVDGVDAIDMLIAGVHPHLAFIDLKMPRMNGAALVERIASMGLGFPMVILTSTASPGFTTRNRLHRAERILTKPADTNQLRSLLRDEIALIDA